MGLALIDSRDGVRAILDIGASPSAAFEVSGDDTLLGRMLSGFTRGTATTGATLAGSDFSSLVTGALLFGPRALPFVMCVS